ncbi:carbohydrate ABC transporter permease [Paenibacillus ginsengarvi]|uniref:Carbohydrate ABC transporter permease n=1 Tax=Paenibacillus ginsengarvi TaxID=400777 RepID=A0A3B0CMK3_9BACL|nr:carbohydrate ABC transporter permease [Paenibacillus ginsengarvi]RKN85489.1 carbohydrate ABC transporter permease [Paenibacillus ginsengarvi]
MSAADQTDAKAYRRGLSRAGDGRSGKPHKRIGNKWRERLADWFVRIVLAFVVVVFFAPLLWLLSTSLKPDTQLFADPVIWIPDPFKWSNYSYVLEATGFLRFFGNSLFIAVLATLGALISSSIVAYGFAKIDWPGRELLFTLMLVTMMIPFEVVMIPLFTVFKHLGWIGTLKPLIIPWWFGDPFSIFILRQFMMGLPNEMSQAAKIDGCSEFGIYARIILPLLKSPLWVVAIFAFMGSWNDFFGPLIYLTDDRHFTLSLGLYSFLTTHVKMWQTMFAYAVLMSLVPLALFFMAQKSFIRGLSMTGFK